MKHLVLFTLLTLLFVGCSKDDDVDYGPIDEALIEEHLAEKGNNAVAHSSGLYYEIVKLGSGSKVSANSQIYVRYEGYYLDGKLFEEGKTLIEYKDGSSDYMLLRNMIKAWQIGIPMLGKGGEAWLYCPSALAYGSSGSGKIPANTVIKFYVKVVDFK